MKNIIAIILIVIVIVFGFIFISNIKKPAQKTAERLFYALFVELTEINHDTFQNQLFVEEGIIQRWPFYLKDGKIMIAKGVIQSIKDGKSVKEYRLFVDKKDIDIQKDVKLFLIHNIIYDGIGRENAFSDYYIFTSFPAKVSFPSSDWSSGKVHLVLDESIGNMLNIRLLSNGRVLIDEAPKNAIGVTYAGKKVTIAVNQEESLSKNTKPITITQEAFAPVPKGPITEQDIKLETVEYGTIKFSTELRAKNHGLCDVHVE